MRFSSLENWCVLCHLEDAVGVLRLHLIVRDAVEREVRRQEVEGQVHLEGGRGDHAAVSPVAGPAQDALSHAAGHAHPVEEGGEGLLEHHAAAARQGVLSHPTERRERGGRLGPTREELAVDTECLRGIGVADQLTVLIERRPTGLHQDLPRELLRSVDADEETSDSTETYHTYSVLRIGCISFCILRQ